MRLEDLRRDDGFVVPSVALLTATALVLTGAVLDYGLAMNATVRALGDAQEAARAGAAVLDPRSLRDGGPAKLDPNKAAAAARAYLASAGDIGDVTASDRQVTVTVTVQVPLMQSA